MNTISANDFLPVEELRRLQLEKLQRIVAYEYERVALFRRRCDERGVKPRDIVTLKDIAKLPFMIKTDLRDEYPLGLTAAPMEEIVRFHCSSGTTGKPICIPNTAGDVEVWAEATARCLLMFGLSAKDILQVTYGYGLFTGGLGLHYGGEKLGCAVLPIGGGNTDKQLMLMQDLGVTAIACTPSYFLHLIDEGMKAGMDFRRDTKLKHGIFGAEPWTQAMREKIESLTGINAHDIYGLTEISGPGVAGDCEYRCGLHVFEDHFYPEIVDPETLEPLPDGEAGELVFTTLDRTGTPMLRYRTRDLSRIVPEVCKCGRTIRRIARVSARSDDMLIVRGVNVFPSQIETVLLNKGYPANYQIVVDRVNNTDTLDVQVEMTQEMFTDNIGEITSRQRDLVEGLKNMLGIKANVSLVAPKSIARSEGKAVRVIDKRKI